LRSWQASKTVASFGLVVDVLTGEKGDPTGFYVKYDFRPFPEDATKLILPMSAIEKSLKILRLIS